MKVLTPLLFTLLLTPFVHADTDIATFNKDFINQVTQNVRALKKIESQYGHITFDNCDDICAEQKPYIASLKKLFRRPQTAKITTPLDKDLFESLCSCLNYYFKAIQ